MDTKRTPKFPTQRQEQVYQKEQTLVSTSPVADVFFLFSISTLYDGLASRHRLIRTSAPGGSASFNRAVEMIFQDRREAGRVLARAVATVRDVAGGLVLGLPRGGVPVAAEVACLLHLPVDVFVVRKLGVSGHEELAMGAIASGGTVVINHSVVDELRIPREAIEAVAEREKREIERREQAYRDGRPPARIDERTVILIDDGLATGSTMLAAARALRPRAKRVIVAVPVAAESACDELRPEVDQIICATTPQPLFAVGQFYRNFEQTTDEEVRTILAHVRSDMPKVA
jgi:putative phosphoribosyl transferase